MGTTGRPLINLYLNWLVVVLCFSIPVYRQWVSVVAPLVVILWFVEGGIRGKLEVLKRHRLTIAVLVFIALNLVSLLWSEHRADGLDYLSKYRYLLLIPVLATSLRGRYRDLAGNALFLGTGISLALSYGVFVGLVRFTDAYPGNPSPSMSHLDYSMVLAVVGLLVVHRIVSASDGARTRLAWFFYLLLIVGGLVVNIGRSGQAAFTGALLVMLPIYGAARSRRRIALVVAGAVFVTLAISFLLVPAFNTRVVSAVSGLDRAINDQRYETSVGKRVAGTIVGIDIVGRHPILGTGVGDNMVEFRNLLDTRYLGLRKAVYWFPHFHNQYIQIATELGLVGLSALLYVMYCLIRGPYLTREDWETATALAVAFAIGFLGDPYLHKQLPLVLFAVVAGMLSANGRSAWWKQ